MSSSNPQSWVSRVFGLVFIVAGLVAFFVTAGTMIVGYVSSSDWIAVPATVHTLELNQKSGESITYSVQSRYSYEYQGTVYENDRVSLSIGSDSFGTYWQDLYTSLQADRSSNEISAYINPDNPREAVLDRTFRWKSVGLGSIYLVAFCGVGSFFFWASFRQSRPRYKRLKKVQNPLSPLDQIAVTEENHCIYIHSRAGRYIVSDFLFTAFGIVLVGFGASTVGTGWVLGYMFMLAGLATIVSSVYSMGKAIETRIDTASWTLDSTKRWMGCAYSQKQGFVANTGQFKIRKTSANQTGKKYTEYYALDFKDRDIRIRLADRIKGKNAAKALKKFTTELIINETPLDKAA